MSEIMEAAPDIDAERLDAITDRDIRGYKVAEGYSPDYRPTGGVLNVPAVADLRERMGLSQSTFARLLRIPVATLQNWEQGRKMPDPAARTLLALVAADPAHAQRILGNKVSQTQTSSATSDANIELAVTFATIISIDAFEPANVNMTFSDVQALA